jgi:hypothetical protein
MKIIMYDTFAIDVVLPTECVVASTYERFFGMSQPKQVRARAETSPLIAETDLSNNRRQVRSDLKRHG